MNTHADSEEHEMKHKRLQKTKKTSDCIDQLRKDAYWERACRWVPGQTVYCNATTYVGFDLHRGDRLTVCEIDVRYRHVRLNVESNAHELSRPSLPSWKFGVDTMIRLGLQSQAILWTEEDVQDVSDVKNFFDDLTRQLGVGWHPDTNFADYVNSESARTYTLEEADRLNIVMIRAFEICDDAPRLDIYDLANEADGIKE